ncbi:hypothetical protein DEO72_LG11g1315 [Vigna unguiculata]|uniref:Uncharacterized protein n=1 Tax=Vigna unguiculata TaxID=3917 RepID=A0A4D6NL04_VIGUN|nr:hypothetical protein DEO72_LG11g1315 [Vigna unguiculata]
MAGDPITGTKSILNSLSSIEFDRKMDAARIYMQSSQVYHHSNMDENQTKNALKQNKVHSFMKGGKDDE